MKLVSIPKEKFEKYRLDAIFDCYKWDPQFVDNNTIAKYALVLTKDEHKELKRLTESMDAERVFPMDCRSILHIIVQVARGKSMACHLIATVPISITSGSSLKRATN